MLLQTSVLSPSLLLLLRCGLRRGSPLGSCTEDGGVRDECFMLMSGQDRKARKDVKVVEVAVSLNEDDTMRGRKLLG